MKKREGMNKQAYIEKLKNGIFSVTFKKVDGEERVMRATLMEEYLPEFVTVHGDRVKNYVSGDAVVSQTGSIRATQDAANTAVRVWDIDKKSWRSFRVDSVINFVQV
jgi:hypothetical protein